MFLEECKYVVKERKIPKYIINDIEICSDSDRENSNKKKSDEEKSDEEKSDEKLLNFFILYIKMVNKYDQKHIEKLVKHKEAFEIYQNLSV